MEAKKVVTSFLQSDSQILLLRRSTRVGTHRGKWAGVSGYLEQNELAVQRAMIEISEETGIDSEYVRLARAGEPLRVLDEDSPIIWVIFPFLFETRGATINIDWEHSEYKWINPDEMQSYETVPRLREAFERVRWDLQSKPPNLPDIDRRVREISLDRVHGASYLGRKAIEILREIAAASPATSADELFRDLLSISLKLRSTQPSMATIGNLTGFALQRISVLRARSSSFQEFREAVLTETGKVLEFSVDSAEDASRNAAHILGRQGNLLTHSYSSTVKRALELTVKGRQDVTIYVTESAPGLEGKTLANDLIKAGVTVKLIADSAVGSIITDVDAVVVGADTILTDGSVINKLGTSQIAKLASRLGKHVYAVCESAKFSTQDFLGESVEFSKTLFDVTPSKCASSIITEGGALEPQEIKSRIREMLSQLYP